MLELYENIRNKRLQLGMSQQELAEKVGYKSRSTINKIELGINDISQSKIVEFAKALKTTPSELMGWDKKTEHKSECIFLDQSLIRSVPVFDSVSAGFGATPQDYVIDYIPLYIKCDYEAENTICINVVGDSMFPKIEDGDKIQVLKQSSVDSGQIAVALIDGEESVVKKVVYGPTWIELHSFNPMYPVRRFDGAEVQRVEILGLVKKIIKDC